MLQWTLSRLSIGLLSGKFLTFLIPSSMPEIMLVENLFKCKPVQFNYQPIIKFTIATSMLATEVARC